MKICWDNLETLRYNKITGKWYKIGTKSTYVYSEKCKNCGGPFLKMLRSKGDFCSVSCSNAYRDNPWIGRHHTEESKRKIRETNTGRKISEKTKKKISVSNTGRKHSKKVKDGMSKNRMGNKNNAWKGGYASNNIPTYDTYASQLDWCEEVRRSPKDRNVLEVKCTYCGKWITPSLRHLKNRLGVLNGRDKYFGEQRFYCSKHCKKACPLYAKTSEALMKEDAIRAGRLQWLELNREVQPELRQIVLERDEYKCVKCGSDGTLYCHHIRPVAEEPLLSADVDNCMTLCENCHKEAHRLPGCGYGEIRMEVC